VAKLFLSVVAVASALAASLMDRLRDLPPDARTVERMLSSKRRIARRKDGRADDKPGGPVGLGGRDHFWDRTMRS
jgi:hypothetical protein